MRSFSKAVASLVPVLPVAESVDSYLAALPPHARELLDELHAIVRSDAPDAGERLSYRVPALFYHGALARRR